MATSNVDDETATGNRFDAFRVSPVRPRSGLPRKTAKEGDRVD